MSNNQQPEASVETRPIGFASGVLLGATVEIKMIGYGGQWLVVREEGKKIWVQRPQDNKPKWVWRRYAKIVEGKIE